MKNQKSGNHGSEYNKKKLKDEEQFKERERNVEPKKQKASRLWYDTTVDKIKILIGIFLLQKEAKLGSIKNY